MEVFQEGQGVLGPIGTPGPHLPLVRDAEVTCQLLRTLVLAAEDEGGDRVVYRQV